MNAILNQTKREEIAAATERLNELYDEIKQRLENKSIELEDCDEAVYLGAALNSLDALQRFYLYE